MKKLFFITLTLAAITVLFSSCKKDETNDISISLAGDAGYTSTDATVTPGETVKIKWTATSSIDMEFVSITKDDIAINDWDKKVIDSDSKSTYVDEVILTAPQNVGAYVYAVVIYDGDKKELGSKSIVITVEEEVVAGQVNSFTAKLLGSQSNAAGSFFASSTGLVYKTSELTTEIKPKIDITYGTLTSGDAVMSASVRESKGFPAISGATETKYIASTLDISTIIDDSQLTTIDFTSATTDIIISLNQVVAFKNASGKIGIFKVVSYTSGASGSITIDVKVQE